MAGQLLASCSSALPGSACTHWPSPTTTTRRGVREAALSAPALGLELIPGIEFTCHWGSDGNLDIDMLGYFMDLADPGLQRLEQAALQDIYDRIAICCEGLAGAGYPVTLADAFAENPRYAGLQQVAQALVRKGYARAIWPDALALVNTHWQSVPSSAIEVERVIETIHAAGGVAVLAHPAAYAQPDGAFISAGQLSGLVKAGLDGLEIYHFALDERARTHFLALARQFDLAISGGSDEHGWRPELDRMGTEPVDERIVEALRDRARSPRS